MPRRPWATIVGLTGATTPPQVREPIHSCPLVIFALRRDIHPVLARLLEYHTVARRLEIPKAVRPAPDDPFLKLTEIRVGDVLEADFDLGRHWRGDHKARIEPITDLKVRAGQHGRIQSQDPADMDFVGAASAPGIPPDVVNRAFDGDDVEAVLGERDLKARVQGTELVGVGEMPSTGIEGNPLFVLRGSWSRDWTNGAGPRTLSVPSGW